MKKKKKKNQNYTSHQLEWLFSKRQELPSVGENVIKENLEHYHWECRLV